jgi:hypothetical protein
MSSLRRVQFRSSASLIDDFVPYGVIYGAHPSDFEFDAHGRMIRPSRHDAVKRMSLEDLMNVDMGNLLECIAPDGVSYRSQPNFSSDSYDSEPLEEGDQVEVLQRRGDWVRDSIGWFPLVVDGMPVFAVKYL